LRRYRDWRPKQSIDVVSACKCHAGKRHEMATAGPYGADRGRRIRGSWAFAKPKINVFN
jgi:hypothetical protein